MTTFGPGGSVVHIDNLDVKPQAVKSNTKIEDGDLCTFDTDGLRPVVAGDFSADDRYLDLQNKPVVLAAAGADNLDTTAIRDRQANVPVLRLISDWVAFAGAGIIPNAPVGVRLLAAFTAHTIHIASVANTVAPGTKEVLGTYKGKRFSTLQEVSVQGDESIVTTGVGVSV